MGFGDAPIDIAEPPMAFGERPTGRPGAVTLDWEGDYDLFDIRKGKTTGEAIKYESLPEDVRMRLESKPVEAQHGAHLDWKEIPAGLAGSYAEICFPIEWSRSLFEGVRFESEAPEVFRMRPKPPRDAPNSNPKRSKRSRAG